MVTLRTAPVRIEKGQKRLRVAEESNHPPPTTNFMQMAKSKERTKLFLQTDTNSHKDNQFGEITEKHAVGLTAF